MFAVPLLLGHPYRYHRGRRKKNPISFIVHLRHLPCRPYPTTCQLLPLPLHTHQSVFIHCRVPYPLPHPPSAHTIVVGAAQVSRLHVANLHCPAYTKSRRKINSHVVRMRMLGSECDQLDQAGFDQGCATSSAPFDFFFVAPRVSYCPLFTFHASLSSDSFMAIFADMLTAPYTYASIPLSPIALHHEQNMSDAHSPCTLRATLVFQ